MKASQIWAKDILTKEEKTLSVYVKEEVSVTQQRPFLVEERFALKYMIFFIEKNVFKIYHDNKPPI